ncbi:Holliday junction resolvase RuvX [bacterium]|nr:Holliday junction resolvase RuvX [bacterium]
MGRILGIDFGLKRIGLAISDLDRCIASPLKTIENNEEVLNTLIDICDEYSVEIIVMGYPYHLSGDKSEICTEIEKFKNRILNAIGLKVILWDERFTSKESERTIRESEIKPSRNKKLVDKVAASFILEAYLQSIEN